MKNLSPLYLPSKKKTVWLIPTQILVYILRYYSYYHYYLEVHVSYCLRKCRENNNVKKYVMFNKSRTFKIQVQDIALVVKNSYS